jgi:hypothetical protein
LNPGSHAPQACILVHARRRPRPTGRRPLNGKVINTLIKLKSSGLADSTVKHVSNNLRFLADYYNLDNPKRAANYIAINTENLKGAIRNGASQNQPIYSLNKGAIDFAKHNRLTGPHHRLPVTCDNLSILNKCDFSCKPHLFNLGTTRNAANATIMIIALISAAITMF